MKFESHEGIPRNIDLAEPEKAFFESDPNLRLNKVIESLEGLEFTYDNSTWVSGTKRLPDRNVEITIGTRELPVEIAELWGISGSSVESQNMYKTSHEVSHTLQYKGGYEQQLTRWLDGDDSAEEKFHPYFELYAKLSGLGRISGLATQEIYRRQSEESGNLSVEILEDITELCSHYLMGDKCLLQRLDASLVNLSDEEKEFIAKQVVDIVQL